MIVKYHQSYTHHIHTHILYTISYPILYTHIHIFTLQYVRNNTLSIRELPITNPLVWSRHGAHARIGLEQHILPQFSMQELNFCLSYFYLNYWLRSLWKKYRNNTWREMVWSPRASHPSPFVVLVLVLFRCVLSWCLCTYLAECGWWLTQHIKRYSLVIKISLTSSYYRLPITYCPLPMCRKGTNL